ncbi:MAG: TadE family protein [Anaerolineales bacterium]
MKRVKFTNPKADQGQSLVEFALGISFILIMLAGVLDLGRAYFTFLSLRDAAQEGALYGSLAPPDTAGIRARVRESSGWPVDFSTFSDAQIQVNITGPACTGSEIKVTLQMNFIMAAPFLGGTTLPLVAEAIDTVLQPAC